MFTRTRRVAAALTLLFCLLVFAEQPGEKPTATSDGGMS